jgi:hypothetical protein
MATPRRSPPTRARREEQRRVLLSALEHIGRAKKPALAIFDLDSTLLDNRPRQARLLREFGARAGSAALAACQPYDVDGWDLRVAMRNAGLAPAEAERLFPAAKAYWRDRFFTSEYCVDDDPLPGTRDFLGRVLSAGGTIVYVTGRDTTMGPGTVECFRRHRFPIPGEGPVDLLLKPALHMGDDSWKEQAHARLRILGTVAAAFDNEPAHINAYHHAFPDAYIVHLDTDHSGRPIPVAESIPSVADFLIEEAGV